MKRLVAALAFAVVACVGQSAQAAPLLGGQLFYTGGDVTVVSLPVSSGYTTELGLYDSAFNRLVYLMNDEPSGVSVTFNPGSLGIGVGNELIFGIRIISGAPLGGQYFMGPAGRNPDQIMHATLDDLGGGLFVVGFEDLLGGGDRDFDDNRFSFRGGVRGVPEPATLSLLALGVIPAIRRRRSSR